MASSAHRTIAAPEPDERDQQATITAPLLLDLLDWLAAGPRGYVETMEAWRTSCPRLPIWEEAVERGFVQRERGDRAAIVRITESGRAFLRQHRP